MSSIFGLTSLLAASEEATHEIVAIFFTVGSFVLAIFFIYQLIYYAAKGLKLLFGSAQKSKAGQIVFSPTVGVPLAIVIAAIIFYILILYGVIDLAGPIEFIKSLFE